MRLGIVDKLQVVALVGAFAFASPANAYSDASLIDGFRKTVFGSEYSGIFSTGAYVRKFSGPVRFFVTGSAPAARRSEVSAFARSLGRLIAGLNVRIVNRESDANFVVHVVNRSDYADTVRNRVYKSANAIVRGRCLVRSVYNRRGISRSDAVIVADEGRPLFRRCMTEEILQGLGPLNDNPTLSASMFNDRTKFTSFRRYDRLLLNMLYDRRIKNGATPKQVEAILPKVTRDVQRRFSGTN